MAQRLANGVPKRAERNVICRNGVCANALQCHNARATEPACHFFVARVSMKSTRMERLVAIVVQVKRIAPRATPPSLQAPSPRIRHPR